MSETLFIDDDDRYSRLRLIAWWDQDKLAAAKVLVVGAGALGNEVLKNLALLGIGHLYIVDFDRIEASNLTRSVLFRPHHRGMAKAQVAAEALADLNPDTQVSWFDANILTDIGLGLFRDVDVVVGCLDNREARLWVNRSCWRAGTPWIDGGIQEINGVVKVFTPPDSACYECSMTENDYKLINLRYSCPLLRQEDIVSGKVPTAPTISSMIAGLQSQEALKLIHGMKVDAGCAMIYNGVSNQFYRTAFQFREDCLSHETYPEPVELEIGSDDSATALFDAINQHIGKSGPLRIELDRDLVVSLQFPDGSRQEVMKPLQEVSMEEAQNDQGEVAKPQLVHSVSSDDELAKNTLGELGVAPYDIVRVSSDDGEATYLLGNDRTKFSKDPNPPAN